MFQLQFELNGQTLSSLKLGAFDYPAFSGMSPYTNKPHAACLERIAGECKVASACLGRTAALFVTCVARHTALLPPCPASQGRPILPYTHPQSALAEAGPIPPGMYYVVDRESGGLLGPIWDRIKNRTDWFALYAIDQAIDDYTYCAAVERGHFRLHPKGPSGISKGCIVMDKHADFLHLRACLNSAKPASIPGSKLKAYGKVMVR